MAGLSAALVGSAGRLFGQAFSDEGLYRIPVESTNDPLNYLVKAHFEPFIGTSFRASASDGTAVTLRLRVVNDLSRALNVKEGYSGESFSLVFNGASKQQLVPGIYNFDHELGKFSLLLSPVAGRSGKYYEAVINRINR